MNKLKIVLALFWFALILIFPMNAHAKYWTASMASMPESAELDEAGRVKGAYVDLIRALDQLTGSETKIKVVPFKRSILNLVEGKVDFHIPLIEPPNKNLNDLPYAFSTQTLFQVAFVLYTNKNKPIDINNLGKYKIATDSAHTGFFDFPITGISCLSCTINMVNAGRLDGFIFAQNEIDPFIIKDDLKNIHRQLYKNFDVKILLPKGDIGKEIDAYFNSGIQTLRKNGKYEILLAPLLSPYREWQP